MAIHSRITGEMLVIPSPLERARARIARMRHIVWLAVKTMEKVSSQDKSRLIMVTLTYRGLKDWRPRHISGFVRWWRGQGVREYVWVAEMQRRGAIHYHVLGLLPEGIRWVKPSLDTGGWGHGFSWVTDNIRHPWYILKYMQKGVSNDEFKRWPSGVRLYSVSRGLLRRFDYDDAAAYRIAQLPRWVGSDARDCVLPGDFRRVTGGVDAWGYRLVSPYSKKGLVPVADIGALMYTNFGNYGNPAAG